MSLAWNMTQAEACILMLFTGKTVLLQNHNHSFLQAKSES